MCTRLYAKKYMQNSKNLRENEKDSTFSQHFLSIEVGTKHEEQSDIVFKSAFSLTHMSFTYENTYFQASIFFFHAALVF